MKLQEIFCIEDQLKDQVNQLRQIPAPDWYGSIGRRPLFDICSGQQYGPFDNIGDMIRTRFDQDLQEEGSAEKFAQIKIFFQTTFENVCTALGHDYPVFTHNDLHGGNILIQPDGIPCIIDYELAGFYPSYHEYLDSKCAGCRLDFLDEYYPQELQVCIDALSAWTKAIMEEEDEE
ncbi:hypothetical protein F4680DRAFT_443573 [Xylaria scruposa]|nr:hypothetical protein F4680DRAFT_443573 [Xylaria scruposa]